MGWEERRRKWEKKGRGGEGRGGEGRRREGRRRGEGRGGEGRGGEGRGGRGGEGGEGGEGRGGRGGEGRGGEGRGERGGEERREDRSQTTNCSFADPSTHFLHNQISLNILCFQVGVSFMSIARLHLIVILHTLEGRFRYVHTTEN